MTDQGTGAAPWLAISAHSPREGPNPIREVRRRFEREAVALQHILPGVHVGRADFLRYLASAVLLDAGAALQEGCLLRSFSEIARFRFAQYWGSYRGNHEHRNLSRREKDLYFYPKGR